MGNVRRDKGKLHNIMEMSAVELEFVLYICNVYNVQFRQFVRGMERNELSSWHGLTPLVWEKIWERTNVNKEEIELKLVGFSCTVQSNAQHWKKSTLFI